jgi:hypothetical protein
MYYSRYADDLCFSSRRRLSRVIIDELVTAVSQLIKGNGFALNARKTRVMKRHRRQAVVGVVLNGPAPRAPRERRRLLRTLLWRAERNGLLAESLRYRESPT